MAFPTKIRPSDPIAPSGSRATGARRISTRLTSMSSRAQPLTGTLPETVAPLVGVSKQPKGAASPPEAAYTFKVMSIVWGEFVAAGSVTRTFPW